MRRFAIIGCGGAGKSTLARLIGARLNLPVHHLDRVFWKPGWVEPPRREFEQRHDELLSGEAWVIDGNYGSTMEARIAAADAIVFLDFPTAVCLWGAIRRWWRYRGRTRPDMTDGNPEKLQWSYLHWILTYRRLRRPSVLQRLNQPHPEKKIFVLQSRSKIPEFLAGLSASLQ